MTNTVTTYRYEGGLPAVEVVLPTRSLVARRGDVVEVSVEEAKALSTVPGFVPSTDREADEAKTDKES